MERDSLLLVFLFVVTALSGCCCFTSNSTKASMALSEEARAEAKLGKLHSELKKHAISKRAVVAAAAASQIQDAVVEKGIEVAGKLVDKQLQIIDDAQQSAEDFLKKELKLDIVPDQGWKSDNMFLPAGYHIQSELSEKEPPPKEVGETPYAYPTGIGGMIMNGCWGTGYTETDPCYNAKMNLSACLSMIDGAAFIGTGFDGRGDYTPDYRRMSIIQRNCAAKQTYDDLDVPDTMNVHGIYETSATMRTFEGRSEYQHYLQEEAGVSGSYIGFHAGVKTAFGSSSAGSEQQYMSLLSVDIIRYEIFKDEVKPQDLSLSFLREFMELPETYYAIGAQVKYNEFLQRWGTHYIKSAKFGGQLQVRKFMDATDVQSKKEFAVEMEAEMNALFASAGAKASGSGGSSARQQNKVTSTAVVVQGGSHEIASILSDVYSPTFKNEFKEWLESIPQYPKPFNFKMAYITDLVNFRANDLFPDEEVNWGCEANFRTLKTETDDNGDIVKYYETVNSQGNTTKHYCSFDSRQALEDAMRRRRSGLARAIQVYLEEGPISVSDVELGACTTNRDKSQLINDLWLRHQIPSWEDITKKSTVLRVNFDMKKDLKGSDDVITRNMSRMVRFRHGRWFTSSDDGVFHIFNAFPKEGYPIKTKEHKLSILGLWLTYDAADGTLSLFPNDFSLSQNAYPGVVGKIPGVPLASVVSEQAVAAATKRQTTGQSPGPCHVRWSNVLRFDPTDKEGKCLHFTAASSGPIFVAFSTLPKDVNTWYYVKVTKQNIEIYKGNTLRTSTADINARGLGNPSLLQSYFVCVSESDSSTLIEYGKTQGSPESGEIYLNMIDDSDNSHVRFYAFGNGAQPVRVMDARITPRKYTIAKCSGDTFQDLETGLCVQNCHSTCDPVAGCRVVASGQQPRAEDCTKCRVAFDPVASRCTAVCPDGTKVNSKLRRCEPSFEIIIRPDSQFGPLTLRDFPTLKEWSMCMWVQIVHTFNFNSQKNIELLSYQGPADSIEDSYEIFIAPKDRSRLEYTVRLSNKGTFTMPFNELNDRTWQHICTTWSGLTGIGQHYLNGELKGSGSNLKATFPGGGEVDLAAYASQVVLLAELNVWNKVLTQEEVVKFGGSCEKATGNVKSWQDFFQLVSDKADRYNNPSSCNSPRSANQMGE